MMGGRVST